MIENLATATPVEIDTELARLDGEYATMEARRADLIERAHRFNDERKVYRTKRGEWPTTTDEALTGVAMKLANDEIASWDVEGATNCVNMVGALEAMMNGNRAACQPFDAEYERRPWQRFFQVSGGKIHAGMWCKGGTIRPSTDRGWRPELANASIADAIAALGSNLCTLCFPDAPVDNAKPALPEGICDNKSYDPDKPMRSGYMSGNFATCSACGTRATLTSAYNLRKHKIDPS